jgi:hypothetical protein
MVEHLSPQATEEAEIGRIVVPGQPMPKSSRNPIAMEKKLDMVAPAIHPIYRGKHKNRIAV